MHPAHCLEYLVISYQSAGPANVPRETDTLCAVPRQVPQSPLLQTKSSCFRITGQRRPSIVQLIGCMSRACFLSISHAHSYSLHLPIFHVKHCFSAPLAINVSRETFIVKWANSGKWSVPHSRMFHVKHKGRTRVDRNTGRRSNLVIRTYPNFLPNHSTHENP